MQFNFRYVKSRNDQQLRDSSKANETNYCDPEKTTPDGSPIVHCGLIACSLFNDTYSFTRGNKNLTVNKKDISWKSDRDHKFGKDVFPKNFQNGTLIGGGKLDPNKSVSVNRNFSGNQKSLWFFIFISLQISYSNISMRNLNFLKLPLKV